MCCSTWKRSHAIRRDDQRRDARRDRRPRPAADPGRGLRGRHPRRRQGGRRQPARLPRRARGGAARQRIARLDGLGKAPPAGRATRSPSSSARRSRPCRARRSRSSSKACAGSRPIRISPTRSSISTASRRSRGGSRRAAGGRLLRETARHLAVRMSFEDVIRVAQAKIAPERFARIRADMRPAADEPLAIIDFLKPGIEEILPDPAAAPGAADPRPCRRGAAGSARSIGAWRCGALRSPAICASSCSPSCGAAGASPTASPRSRRRSRRGSR